MSSLLATSFTPQFLAGTLVFVSQIWALVPRIYSLLLVLGLREMLICKSIVPLCLSAQLPTSVIIDGFDISTAQFPPQEWLPQNVHLHEQNVFTPFPAEQLAKYDIVHLRFMSTLIDSHNLGQLILNVKALLSITVFSITCQASLCFLIGGKRSLAGKEPFLSVGS